MVDDDDIADFDDNDLYSCQYDDILCWILYFLL